jgi:hypothetical protein
VRRSAALVAAVAAVLLAAPRPILTRRTSGLLILALLVVGLLAACGGDGDEASETTTATRAARPSIAKQEAQGRREGTLAAATLAFNYIARLDGTYNQSAQAAASAGARCGLRVDAAFPKIVWVTVIFGTGRYFQARVDTTKELFDEGAATVTGGGEDYAALLAQDGSPDVTAFLEKQEPCYVDAEGMIQTTPVPTTTEQARSIARRLRAAGYVRVKVVPPRDGYPASVAAYRGNKAYQVDVWPDASRAKRHAAEDRAKRPEDHILVIDNKEYFGFDGAELTTASWPLIRQFASDAEDGRSEGSGAAHAAPTEPPPPEPGLEVTCGVAASGGTLTAKGLPCSEARRLAIGYLDSGFEPRGYSCAADRIICWRGAATYEDSSYGFTITPGTGG